MISKKAQEYIESRTKKAIEFNNSATEIGKFVVSVLCAIKSVEIAEKDIIKRAEMSFKTLCKCNHKSPCCSLCEKMIDFKRKIIENKYD